MATKAKFVRISLKSGAIYEGYYRESYSTKKKPDRVIVVDCTRYFSKNGAKANVKPFRAYLYLSNFRFFSWEEKEINSK